MKRWKLKTEFQHVFPKFQVWYLLIKELSLQFITFLSWTWILFPNLSFSDWRVIWTKSFLAKWKCHPGLGKINFASIQSFFLLRDWFSWLVKAVYFFQWQRHKLQLIHALSCASSSYDIVCNWRVWSWALKKLELLSAAPQAGLVPLLFSPKVPACTITRQNTLKHESMADLLREPL